FLLEPQEDLTEMFRRMSLFGQLPPEKLKPFLPQIFQRLGHTYEELLLEQMKDGKQRLFPGPSVIWEGVPALRDMFDQYLRQDRAGAISAFRKIMGTMLKMATDRGQLDNIITTKEGHSEVKTVIHGLNETPYGRANRDNGLAYDPDFLKEVWDQHLSDAYLERFQAFLQSKKNNGPKGLFMAYEQAKADIAELEAKGILINPQSLKSEVEKKLVDGIRAINWEDTSLVKEYGQSARASRAWTIASNPEIYEKYSTELKPSLSEIVTELKGMGAHPKIVEAYSKASGIGALDLDIIKLQRLLHGRPPEELNDLLANIYPMIKMNLSNRGDAQLKLMSDVSDWLRKSKPDRIGLAAAFLDPNKAADPFSKLTSEGEKFLAKAQQLFQERYALHLKQAPNREEALVRLIREFEPWYHSSPAIVESTMAWFPESPEGKLRLFSDFFRASVKVNPKIPGMEVKRYLSLDPIIADLKKGAQVFDGADPNVLTEAFFQIKQLQNSRETDALFEAAWKATEKFPTLRARFRDADAMKLLHFDENRRRLVQWQLNDKFRVEDFSRAYKAEKKALPTANNSRAWVENLAADLDKKLPQPSALKNELINWVQTSVMTNEAETKLLDKRKIQLENWFESRELAALDFPQKANKLPRSQYERMQLLRYLIGDMEELPAFVKDFPKEKDRQDAENVLRNSKKYFQQAEVGAQTYVLQPMLDQKNGLLSDPKHYEEVLDLLMGKDRDEVVLRKVLKAYLESVPESEAKVLLGRVLAGRTRSASGSTLKALIEAMGPFGVRAAQFMRASGLAGPRFRDELDGFFDQALPPDRGPIFEKLKEVFGKDMKPVGTVRGLAGSGTLNYIVVVDLKDPKTGKPRRVAVRILKDAVENQLANENDNWLRTIERLAKDEDAKIRDAANLAQEARGHAYKTLKPGGIELDLSYEREAFKKAQTAYAKPAGKSGYKIEVARPIEDLQALLPENLQKSVSVYEYIPNTKLKALGDKALQAAIAEEIVDAELEAALQRGVFDPDGHPGNWLVDPSEKRLVRIDYAQLNTIPTERLRGIRQSLGELVLPAFDAQSVTVLSKDLSTIFDDLGTKPLAEDLERILKDSKFLALRNPQDRIFFLRDELARTRPGVRIAPDAMSVLASVGKLSVYEEFLPEGTLTRLIGKHLEVSPARYFFAVGRDKIERLKTDTAKQGGIGKTCAAKFKDLIGRK
ncbi:MAG: AarF/UbiB family protein, partial [Bdellovibrionota bacterium]